MRKTGTILVAAAIVLSVAYAFVMFRTPERYCRSCTVDGKGIRFVQDYYDRGAYYVRGLWYIYGMGRTRELSPEYPPLAVYVFGVPFALADIAGHSKPSPLLILNLLTAMMVAAYLGLMLVTRRLLRDVGAEEWRLFVFLLPGFLYFSLNRYDAIPALMVSAALLMVFQNRPGWAGALLGLGAMTKWYPVLLAPICLTYFYRQDRRKAALFTVYFFMALALISLPMLVSGGPGAFFDPYKFQVGRGGDPLSLFGLIASLRGAELPRGIRVILLVLQLIIPLFALLSADKSKEAFLDWAILSLLAFVFFAKFYSPQWIIWVVPLLILRIKRWPGIVLIVAWDLIGYLLFPVLYDIYGIHDNAPGVIFSVAVLAKTAILIALAADPARGIWRDFMGAARNDLRHEERT